MQKSNRLRLHRQAFTPAEDCTEAPRLALWIECIESIVFAPLPAAATSLDINSSNEM